MAERPVQHSMNMADRSRRQRPTLVASGAEQGGVELIQVHRLQLLQPRRADVGRDVKPKQLLVSLQCFSANV